MAGTSWPGRRHMDVELSVQPRAAAMARQAVQEVLDRWQVPPARVEDAELIASELVANTLRHGRQPMELSLALATDALTVAVLDHSTTLPHMLHASVWDERGRGLPIVATLAQTWGVHAVPGGKQVWACLPVDMAAGTARPHHARHKSHKIGWIGMARRSRSW